MSETSIDLQDGLNESVFSKSALDLWNSASKCYASAFWSARSCFSLIRAICFTMIKNKAFILYLKVKTS